MFLAHSDPISTHATWLRMRTDTSCTVPAHFAIPERSRHWSWLIHQNAGSFIILMWSIVSSWFCSDELGSKRAPIPYSSIFPLAATLRQALLCAARSIQRIWVQGSVGQIRLLKFQSVEMSEKLQTTFWTLLMSSPWTSGNQKCTATGNTFWNDYFFKGNLVKRREVLKQTTNTTFDTECTKPNLALIHIQHVTEKAVCVTFAITFRHQTT